MTDFILEPVGVYYKVSIGGGPDDFGYSWFLQSTSDCFTCQASDIKSVPRSV